MLFQKKLDRMMENLHENSDDAEAERRKQAGEDAQQERPELEKTDIPAMLIAAFLTFLPAVLLVFGVLALIAWLFIGH